MFGYRMGTRTGRGRIAGETGDARAQGVTAGGPGQRALRRSSLPDTLHGTGNLRQGSPRTIPIVIPAGSVSSLATSLDEYYFFYETTEK